MLKLIRSWRSYLYYRSIIHSHKEALQTSLGLRIDRLCRLYTVFSITEKEYENYGEELMEVELKKYLKRIDAYLINAGVAELYGLSRKERINDFQYSIEIRYKPLDILSWANALTIIGGLILTGMGIGLSLYLLLLFF